MSESGPQAERLTVPHRSFEGLFLRSLKLSGAPLEAVRRAGFDPDHPQDKYPPRIWYETRTAVIAALYPHLSGQDAMRKLGQEYCQGFARTVVGSVFAAAAPLLGPDRVLTRIPSYMRAAREDVEVSLEHLGSGHWRVTMREEYALPHFVAGALEAMLWLTHVEAVATPSELRGQEFTVDVRWSP